MSWPGLGLEHCALVHLNAFSEYTEAPIEKVKWCRQLITLVKPISREILSEVGQIISLKLIEMSR